MEEELSYSLKFSYFLISKIYVILAVVELVVANAILDNFGSVYLLTEFVFF